MIWSLSRDAPKLTSSVSSSQSPTPSEIADPCIKGIAETLGRARVIGYGCFSSYSRTWVTPNSLTIGLLKSLTTLSKGELLNDILRAYSNLFIS